MMLTRRIMLAAIAGFWAGPGLAAPGLRLLMVRREGCVYCAEWDREIAPVYSQHVQGRAAPLMVVDLDGPYPDGLALARKPWLTPTFILLRDGTEVTRFEGYPGADRFFAVLQDMLDQARALG